MLPSVAEKIDNGERFMLLDNTQLLCRGVTPEGEPFPGETGFPGLTHFSKDYFSRVDWNPVFRKCNSLYDRLVAANSSNDRIKREHELDRIEEELIARRKDATDEVKLNQLYLGKEPGKRLGEAIGDILASKMEPAIRKHLNFADNAEQRQRNLHIAFALALYRHDHGRYPEKLEALAPKYLAKVPDDLFSGEALIYFGAEEGYSLYSVGVNGVDDMGRSFESEPRGDDVRVLMPLPTLDPIPPEPEVPVPTATEKREDPASRGYLVPVLVGGAVLLLILALLCVRWRKRRAEAGQKLV